MKMFVVSLLLLAILVGAGIVSERIIDNICEDMTDRADALFSAVGDLRIGEALDCTDEMAEIWDEKEKVLAALIDHKYLGDVKLNINKVRQNLIFNKPEMASENVVEINIALTEIHNMGHLNLENIL